MSVSYLSEVLRTLDLAFPPEWVRAALVLALLGSLVVIGLFTYLNQSTRKGYFHLWTFSWVYYTAFLVASIGLEKSPEEPFLMLVRRACVGIGALYMFYGSFEFAGQGRSRRELYLGSAMMVVWSAVAAYIVRDPMWITMPVFVLLSSASLYTGMLYARFCRQYRGAVILTLGFVLWGVHLLAFPFVQVSAGAIAGEYVSSAVLALFIAMGMMVQVLEEAHLRNDTLTKRVKKTVEQSRKLQEHAGEVQDKYRALLDTASDATFVVDLETAQIVEANLAANHLIGVHSGSLIGRSFLDLCPSLRLQGKSLLADRKIFETVFQTNNEFHILRANGTTVVCTGSGRHVQGNTRPAVQVTIRQASEPDRLERQLRSSEKLAALGQLIASVAHELNNPLSVLTGYSQLLSKRVNLDDKLRGDVQKIVHESERASKIVRNLLAFARPRDPQKVTVDINQIVSNVLATRSQEILTGNIRVEKQLTQELPKTKADLNQIEQVLNNVITNALQAQPPGDRPGLLEITTSTYGAYLRITVTDAGPGIPKDILCKIFEPFYSSRPPGLGTGLGLTIAQTVLEEHQGKIWVQSELGRGTTFFIELPIVSCAEEELPASVAPVAPGHYRLLIIDDEPGIVDVLRETLSARGYLADTANNGAIALQLISQHRYDLILSDLRMPDMDGEEFYHTIKGSTPELANRIVFLTGDTISSSARTFLDWTGNRWFSKPFNIADVERTVDNFLRRRTELLNTVVQ